MVAYTPGYRRSNKKKLNNTEGSVQSSLDKLNNILNEHGWSDDISLTNRGISRDDKTKLSNLTETLRDEGKLEEAKEIDELKVEINQQFRKARATAARRP